MGQHGGVVQQEGRAGTYPGGGKEGNERKEGRTGTGTGKERTRAYVAILVHRDDDLLGANLLSTLTTAMWTSREGINRRDFLHLQKPFSSFYCFFSSKSFKEIIQYSMLHGRSIKRAPNPQLTAPIGYQLREKLAGI